MTAFEQYSHQRYFKSLDGVRFLSIIAVIWHHSYPPDLPLFFSRGFLGVDMFFVLSGYLIVTLLLREKNNNNQKISLKNFYIRRALRIFPVYFGVLLALSFIYGVLKPHDPDSEQFFSLLGVYLAFVANWSLIHAANLSIYWSLATEEQFYIVWPLIEKVCRPRTILMVLFTFIVINQCINFGYFDSFFTYLYGGDTEGASLEILEATFTPICFGVLLAHTLNNKVWFARMYTVLSHKWASGIILFTLLLVVFLSPKDISGVPRLLIQWMMCLWLASLVVREGHVLEGIMCFFPIKRLGQISYGMYVYHMFALHIVRELLQHYGIGLSYYYFILGFFITVFIAEMSFRLYESPILSLSKKYRTTG
jgi:peptidoglycan/LPS O-acetylase OafA/YrhL